ncbi:unnamed protein product [Protopolystoma xenopodis]|uniref:Uncharacterized protein n=1 Tax=Protopolystoma xenopodis TaxID=117903 RepID=A0A3S5BMN9_9PLAT|nr:unnamed protein product [Protopolystoma xenopodis]
MVNDYLTYYGGSWKDFNAHKSRERNDTDIIRKHHRFLWSDQDEPTSWAAKLAKRYWDKLFKEYCLIDLTRYKENKFGMRWRLEREVVSGKGQFICGNVSCSENDNLRSWEVNFAYREFKEKRNALVKVRLCRECSDKLNYRYKRKEVIPALGDSAKSSNLLSTNVDGNLTRTLGSDSELPGRDVEDPLEPSEHKRPRLLVQPDFEPDAIWRNANASSDSGLRTRDDEFAEYFQDMLL